MQLGSAGYPATTAGFTLPIFPTSPDAAVIATIATMKRLAVGGATASQVRDLATSAAAASSGSLRSLLDETYRLAKSHLRFRTDEHSLSLLGLPSDNEMLLQPSMVATNPGIAGDCDDYSTFIAAILIATYAPLDIYFVTVAADPEQPSEYSHVYLAVVTPDDKWTAMDASHGGYLGWEYGRPLRKRAWLVSKGNDCRSREGEMPVSNTIEHMRGLGDVPLYQLVTLPDGSSVMVNNSTGETQQVSSGINVNQLAQLGASTVENVLMTKAGTVGVGPAGTTQATQTTAGTSSLMPLILVAGAVAVFALMGKRN